MIKVVIELHPYGDSDAARGLLDLSIENVTDLVPNQLGPDDLYRVNTMDYSNGISKAFMLNHDRGDGVAVLVEKALSHLTQKR